MVMQYLYNGGVDSLEVDQTDVLELMAAANFFQLEGLLRFCEAQCALLVDLDNIVSMYIHAKVILSFKKAHQKKQVLTRRVIFALKGVRCWSVARVLPGLLAAEYGGAADLRRLGEASAIWQKAAQSRRAG